MRGRALVSQFSCDKTSVIEKGDKFRTSAFENQLANALPELKLSQLDAYASS